LREIFNWPKETSDPIVLSSAEDGSGIGAAVIASLTIKRLKEGNSIGISKVEGLA
jgi:hexokinase